MANQESCTVFDESIRESLSALLDGEATELETRRVLANIEGEPELRATWSRYQAASRAIRGDAQVVPQIDLSSSISAAIADETSYEPGSQSVVSAKPNRFAGFTSQLGKGAIAASVALAAVFGVNQYTATNQSVPQAEVAAVTASEPLGELNAASNLPMGYGTPGLTVRNVSTDSGALQPRRQTLVPVQFVSRTEATTANPAVEEFLRQLMAEHANASTENQSAIPFERVPRVAIESE